MHNLLNGNVSIRQNEKAKLKKYKQIIRKLASKNTTIKEKKNIMIRKYSIFKIILPLIFNRLENEIRKENDNGSMYSK